MVVSRARRARFLFRRTSETEATSEIFETTSFTNALCGNFGTQRKRVGGGLPRPRGTRDGAGESNP